jgi:hypothetical protein
VAGFSCPAASFPKCTAKVQKNKADSKLLPLGELAKITLSFSFCHQKENRNKRKSAKTS